jgi:tagaturonate reductase
MPRLSTAYLLTKPDPATLNLPDPALLLLPEKVMQFGTGALLRALPDCVIDKANRQGEFNGRIVVVKSTGGGDLAAFRAQDNLYTVCIRGVEQGQPVQENQVCSAISRVLTAGDDWAEVLRLATSTDLTVVLSNTTEVGIQPTGEDIRQTPPCTFPGKLLAVLYARYQAFVGDPARGLVIVPTELIPDNGTVLAKILLDLARQNTLEPAFLDWLSTANTCCNSLVDRIVPGHDAATQYALEHEAGYTDTLLTMTEPFRLWAIEGDERVRAVLSFEAADRGVVVQPDIRQFRELKLRLLNGTHTLSCGLAYLAGFGTVRHAMDDADLSAFIQTLMVSELIPGIPVRVGSETARRFAQDVLDRFRNPYIEHRWLTITMNYSAKMRLRNVPTLLHLYEQSGTVPQHIALGFAGYLRFMRGVVQTETGWQGELNGTNYPIQDDQADYFAGLWRTRPPAELPRTVLQNVTLWGHDLTDLPGFAEAVSAYLQQLLTHGARATVANLRAEAGPADPVVLA